MNSVYQRNRADYHYYDWDGTICRLSGDIFKGTAEMYSQKDRRWVKGHFFNIQEHAGMITPLEAMRELTRQSGLKVFAGKARQHLQLVSNSNNRAVLKLVKG